ncbi:MAG: RICIN domain-containing protein [Thiohalocapsa sp.]|nr:RICIN domain-containing protein [Thiohalocapsa sp.]
MSPANAALTAIALSLASLPAHAQLQFEDATAASGLTRSGESWGASWNDFNGDGWPDLFASGHRGPVKLYRNNADGTFTDVASDVMPGGWFTDPLADTHGAAFGDLDNDGDEDFFFFNWNYTAGDSSDVLVNDAGIFWASGLQDRTVGRFAALFDWTGDNRLDAAVVSWGGWKFFRQASAGGIDMQRDTGTGSNCRGRGDFALLMHLDDDNSPELVCGRQARFPEAVEDTTSRPFTDVGDRLPSTANVLDAIVADLNGDLRGDILTVRGAMRRSGVGLVNPNRIEAWLDGIRGSETKGFRFTSNGTITVTADFSGLGPFGEPQQIVLDPAGPTTGVAGWVQVDYDSGSAEWTVTISNQIVNDDYDIGNSRRAYVTIDTERPAGNIATFGFDRPELPLPARLIASSPAGWDYDYGAGLNTPVSCNSVVVGDFDNDMDQDVYMACSAGVENIPNRLYLNDGAGNFTEVDDAAGARGPLGVGLGGAAGIAESVTAADYDNDGFLDLFVTNGLLMRPWGVGGPDVMFRNASGDNGNTNHWLQIKLEGTTSNRDGIGARVYVTAGGKTQYRAQDGGYHRWSQNDRRLHFGLANNRMADVEIRWPSGRVDRFEDVVANGIYVAQEAGTLQPGPAGPPIDPPPPPPPSDPACGEPSYSSPTDTGVFLWRDCSVTGAEERWNVRITGGGSDSTITYAGLITSSATLQTDGFSLEGNDVLDSTPGDGTVDFDLKAIRGGQDGFALRFGEGADVCFNPATLPAGAVVKVGADGQTLTGAFNLQTLEACDGAPPPSPVTLTARHSGKCADVDSASMQDGASVLQWTCTGGDHQRWVFEPAGAGYYTVTSVNSGLCLAVAGASQANAAKVVQSICNGSHSQQITYDNGEMRFRHSGQCMDVSGQSAADGADIIQWPCNGQMNQRFDRN